jgi:two-component system OmpR family sensor kinase
MSSSLRTDAARAPRTRHRSRLGRPTLQGWTLRRKLLAAILALFAVVCLVIGVVSTVALREFLIGQLDKQLSAAAARAGGPGHRPNTGPPSADTCDKSDPSNDLIPFGQPVGTVGAQIINGQLDRAQILRDQPVGSSLPGACPQDLTAEQSVPLADVQTDGKAHTVVLGDLGEYRVIATRLNNGQPGTSVMVTGMPINNVQDTVRRLVVTEAVVIGAGLILAGAAAFTIVRLSLRPLSRVAATAGRVAELPLDKGEVDLSVRVPDADTDPRTEVGQVGAALNRMLGHVGQALAVRQASEMRVRQFVADASHELRTPLAAIRGYAELTRRGRDTVPPDIAHALGRVESESARMTTLVDDLLLLARLDSGRPLDRDPVELSRLVVDAVTDAHAAGRDHQWRLELPDEAVTVPGDTARLHQVLANLLANARTHTPHDTIVVTRLSTVDKDWAVITVTDNGPGIPERLQPDIFERFARGDSSRSRAAGSTGLGLAIVSAVVEAHGGTVGVTSRPGQTSFEVRLPGAEQGPND